MKQHFVLGAALAVSAGLGWIHQAGAAQTARPATADRDACIFSRSVQDFRALDRNKLVVWAPGRRNAYLVELTMPLSDLKFAHEIALVDRNRDGRLCSYGMDRIVVGNGFLREPSTISGVTRLDEARLAQLEAQYGVKLTRQKQAQKAPDDSGRSPSITEPPAGQQ
jgi:Family of unknown function (DUF6491)